MHGQTQRESRTFEKFKSFVRGQFSRSLSPFWPVILLCNPWLICLRTLPLGAHAPLSQNAPRCEGVWEKQESPWPGVVPWLLTPKEPFCTGVCLPCPKERGSGNPLILYSDKVLPLFVPAMTVTLNHPQETKLGYLPCLCHCFHFGEQTRGWFQMSNLKPAYLLSLSLLPFRRANKRLISNV